MGSCRVDSLWCWPVLSSVFAVGSMCLQVSCGNSLGWWSQWLQLCSLWPWLIGYGCVWLNGWPQWAHLSTSGGSLWLLGRVAYGLVATGGLSWLQVGGRVA